jgi:hypothetical protein
MSHAYSGISANIHVKTVDDAVINCYEDAHQFLGGASWRKLASNVAVEQRLMAGYIAIVLYQTEIVRYYPDGTFSVDNGGYNTPTTRTRIMQFTPSWFWCYHDKKKLVGSGAKGELTHAVRMPVERQTSGVGWPD